MIRMAAYATVLAVIMLILIYGQIGGSEGLRLLVASDMAPTLGTSEFSAVEWLQVAMLALIIGLGWRCSRLLRQHRVLAYLMMSVAAVALIRELDLFLDYYLVDHAWQVIVALMLVGVFVYQYRNRRALGLAYQRAMPSPGIAMMLAGIVVLLVFANLFGHEPFWQSLAGDGYRRVIKIAAEELVELLGYWLWLAGQLEFTLDCRAQHALSSSGERRKRNERRS